VAPIGLFFRGGGTIKSFQIFIHLKVHIFSRREELRLTPFPVIGAYEYENYIS